MVQEFAKGSGGWVLKKLAKLCCYAVALAAVAGADCCSLYRACPSSAGQVRLEKLSRLMVAVYQIASGYSRVPRSILSKISF